MRNPSYIRSEGESGFTLIELIVVVTIVGVLALGILPITRFQVRRAKEQELHYDLLVMRRAIDKYKEACDRGGFPAKQDTFGYPNDLNQLVDGVEVQGKRVQFLRAIPLDPMTGSADWGLRSMQDDPDSTTWGGQNVWNVYSRAQGTALNGTKYASW